MADVNVTRSGQSLDGNNDYYLKVAQFPGRPRTVILHLIDVNSCDGTVTVKARPDGSSVTPVAIPYQSLHLNGSAGTGGLVTTGITGTSLIAIEADGLELVLTMGSLTTGSMTLTYSLANMA